MGKVAGIRYLKNANGKPVKITIDLNKWGEDLQDFLDHIAILERKNDKVYSFDKIVKRLDNKHGIRDRQK